MSEIVALGYAGITAKDPAAWGTFATEVLGMQIAAQPQRPSEPETVYLRYDERSWRIAVERGEDRGVAYLGFEVPNRSALESVKARLEAAGVAVKQSPEVAAARRVVDVLQLNDPSGIPLEIFYGAKVEGARFASPRAVQFVTGDQGMGHAVIVVNNTDETYDFYVELLGFRLSDVITFGGQPVLFFTHVNPRHHTLAFQPTTARPPGAPESPIGLHHIMVEVEDVDDVGRALDLVQDRNIPLLAGLGRHPNDRMLSFYCLSPSGLAIEYGWGARTVDDATWKVSLYDIASAGLWGHRPPPGSPFAPKE